MIGGWKRRALAAERALGERRAAYCVLRVVLDGSEVAAIKLKAHTLEASIGDLPVVVTRGDLTIHLDHLVRGS